MKTLTIISLLAAAGFSQAATIDLQFEGVGGVGLLPTNEIGTGAEVMGASSASGSILPGGLSFDDVSKVLTVNFAFTGLTGGFFEEAAGGIHIHGPANFTTNAGIAINLATDSDFTLTVNADDVSGSVTGSKVLTSAQESDLLNGLYYVNIHSDGFGGGELRGNITAVPEPSTAILAGLGIVGLLRRRRR